MTQMFNIYSHRQYSSVKASPNFACNIKLNYQKNHQKRIHQNRQSLKLSKNRSFSEDF